MGSWHNYSADWSREWGLYVTGGSERGTVLEEGKVAEVNLHTDTFKLQILAANCPPIRIDSGNGG